ncbi:daptide biosynthesis RiPP recognition protein [Microbacterium sp. PMB16]|uniref:daptide biosynthesis RiPP recognition protein n=1 Tax=Microbacterium sp. PMB16 TaxID=3120157 RepID=UPI003F4B2D32
MSAISTSAPRSSHRTAAAFEQYVSGRRAIGSGWVFFLESGEHVGEVLRIAASGDAVIAPSTATATAGAVAVAGMDSDGGVGVIGYDGDWQEPGDEMTLDRRHTFELQDYLAAPFISIVGLTVVRQGTAAGIAAFFSDADSARTSGAFVDQLLSSAVLLDSRASFVGGAAPELARVHVTADGEYRDGPDGLLLGRVGDSRAAIDAAALSGAGRGRAFARIIAGPDLSVALDARPWFERYVAALDLLRQWDRTQTRLAISGFGGHLVSALDDSATEAQVVSADAPFLVTVHDDEHILVERAARRRFRLGLDAARAAECLIATGDEDAASRLLSAGLGRATHEAGRVVREIRTRFAAVGIDLTSFARGAE